MAGMTLDGRVTAFCVRGPRFNPRPGILTSATIAASIIMLYLQYLYLFLMQGCLSFFFIGQ